MEYTVLIHPAEEGGFWAEVPELPGCYSQGETVEEALSNSREAIEAHLMALKEEGVAAQIEDDYCHIKFTRN
jgi:predicted RNase H-like HicB family nuclease